MKFKIKTAHTFTLRGLILYYIVISVMVSLILIRNDQNIWGQLGVLSQYEVGSHISNFALSTLLIFAVGAMNMLSKLSWRYVVALAAILIVANFVVELFITVLNTKDIVDAIYGTAGVFLGVGLLCIMQKYGITALKP